jgi:hypothetical protein
MLTSHKFSSKPIISLIPERSIIISIALMYVSMYVCMYACMHVCVYVCMHVYVVCMHASCMYVQLRN